MTHTPENQQKYKKKMNDKGLTRVTVWVPNVNKEELVDIAVEMRDEFLDPKKAASS